VYSFVPLPRGLVALVLLLAAPLVAGELFPQPLHLTRQITDPVVGTTTIVDEYYVGNRAVSLSGDVTAIADYGEGTLTRIDHAAGVYSITRFDDLARAVERSSPAPLGAAAERRAWNVERREPGAVAGRPADLVRLTPPAGRRNEGLVRVDVALDRSITLPRAAIEVIAGIAWPARRHEEHGLLLQALGGGGELRAAAAAHSATLPLPLRQSSTYVVGSDTLTIVSEIVRVGSELPPAGRLLIPHGARLEEDVIVRLPVMLEQIDAAPPHSPRQ
jgi:hypothetical protein